VLRDAHGGGATGQLEASAPVSWLAYLGERTLLALTADGVLRSWDTHHARPVAWYRVPWAFAIVVAAPRTGALAWADDGWAHESEANTMVKVWDARPLLPRGG
jgi:hypothetical protein